VEAARFAKNGWERTAGGDGIEIRVARTLLIAVRPQFVAAREAELRHAGDHGQVVQIQAVLGRLGGSAPVCLGSIMFLKNTSTLLTVLAYAGLSRSNEMRFWRSVHPFDSLKLTHR
jgi:hypothetical protein